MKSLVHSRPGLFLSVGRRHGSGRRSVRRLRSDSAARRPSRPQIAAVIANEDQFFRLVELGMKDAATAIRC